MGTIFEALRLDHDDQRDLLERLDATEGDSKTRRELFERLRTELEAHAAIEERVFYASLLGEKQGRKQAAHSIGEHEEQRSALEELGETDYSSPGWLVAFRKLRHRVEHHVDEEEREIFPLAGRLMDESEKAEMAERFYREKKRAVAERS